MSCKFCESMNEHLKLNSFTRTTHPDDECRYSVAIVKRYFMKGRRGCYSRETDYRLRGCGYALNYCPECGRKIEGSTTNGMVV